MGERGPREIGGLAGIRITAVGGVAEGGVGGIARVGRRVVEVEELSGNRKFTLEKGRHSNRWKEKTTSIDTIVIDP